MNRGWMEQGTELFLETLAALPDEELDEPSGLPGWSRRHVVAHVHFNAEALRRLVSWARTGREQRMYVDSAQRTREIEGGTQLPAASLRALVASSAASLAADLDRLTARQFANEVVTAQGRTVPASEIVWLRTREVAVHAVDLRAGVDFTELPPDLCTALVLDVARKRAGSGEAVALARWLTGRSPIAPPLGAWL